MIRHTVALVIALAIVVVVNRIGPPLLEKLGYTVPGTQPVMTNADLCAFLVLAFAAGFFGAMTIGVISRPLHWAPVALYFAIGLVLDALAVLNTLAGFPAWFRYAFVGSLPVQVWLGLEAGGAIPY